MIEFIAEPIHVKDFLLGAFMFLALRRGRVDSIIGGLLKWFPNEKNPKVGTGEVHKQADESKGGE